MEIFIFIIVAVLIAFGIYWSYQQQLRRREELTALAGQLEWSFDPDHDSSHDEQYAQFSVFQQGHSRYAFNTLRGTLNVGDAAWPAQMGDYHYQITSSNGKTTSTHTYIFSYLILDLPYGSTPSLIIRREGVFDKLAGALGFDDIDFESDEFSRRFHVKGGDKRFAYDVIHPRMMEFLLEDPPPSIEIENGACCVHDRGEKWTPQEFRTRLDWASAFFALWPRHITAQLDRERSTT
ncbi:MAG: hypothetical protein WD851_21810 [Pirellulales bacterium]